MTYGERGGEPKAKDPLHYLPPSIYLRILKILFWQEGPLESDDFAVDTTDSPHLYSYWVFLSILYAKSVDIDAKSVDRSKLDQIGLIMSQKGLKGRKTGKKDRESRKTVIFAENKWKIGLSREIRDSTQKMRWYRHLMSAGMTATFTSQIWRLNPQNRA